MKTWVKILGILIVLGIVGGVLGYKFVYNKPHVNYEKAKPDFSMNVNDFFEEYRKDKNLAQQKFNGKVVEITGILSKVETTAELTIAVFALEQGMFGDEGIRATILSHHSENLQTYNNKEIVIKGYCTGYNDTDVILEKCSIIK